MQIKMMMQQTKTSIAVELPVRQGRAEEGANEDPEPPAPLESYTSLITDTPLHELEHPVLIALEGEDRVPYALADVIAMMHARAREDEMMTSFEEEGDEDPERIAALRDLHAMRMRDNDPSRRPRFYPLLLGAEGAKKKGAVEGAVEGTGEGTPVQTRTYLCPRGPFTRRPFAVVDIAPVRLIAVPALGAAEEDDAAILAAQAAYDRMFRGTLDHLFHMCVVAGFTGEHADALLELRADPSLPMPYIDAVGAGGAPVAGAQSGVLDSALIVAIRGGPDAYPSAVLERWLTRAQDDAERAGWVNRRVALGVTPLLALIGGGSDAAYLNSTMLKVLLDARADPNLHTDADGHSPLALLARTPRPYSMHTALELLARAGARAEPALPGDPSPMAIAARLGRTELIRRLHIEFHAQPDGLPQRRVGGRTPLMLAAEGGHTAAVTLLLAIKASLTATDLDGETAFHHAARANQGAVLCTLHAHSLSLAARGRDAVVVELAAQDNVHGHTPLLVAARSGCMRAVVALLQAPPLRPGDDDGDEYSHESETTPEGHTALRLAAAGGFPDTVAALLRLRRWSPAALSGALGAAVIGGHLAVSLALHDAGAVASLVHVRNAIAARHFSLAELMLLSPAVQAARHRRPAPAARPAAAAPAAAPLRLSERDARDLIARAILAGRPALSVDDQVARFVALVLKLAMGAEGAGAGGAARSAGGGVLETARGAGGGGGEGGLLYIAVCGGFVGVVHKCIVPGAAGFPGAAATLEHLDGPRGRTALHAAAEGLDAPMVDLLLRVAEDDAARRAALLRAVEDDSGLTPLAAAIVRPAAAFYVASGASCAPGSNGASAARLPRAFFATADPRDPPPRPARDPRDRTMRLEAKAFAEGVTAVATRLLDAGADVHATDAEGVALFHLAVVAAGLVHALTPLLELLIARGALGSEVAAGGGLAAALAWTPRPSPRIVALLLAHGAPVNARDADGNTPLHLALRPAVFPHGLRCVHTLLRAGADVFAVSGFAAEGGGFGKAPLALAQALRADPARRANPAEHALCDIVVGYLKRRVNAAARAIAEGAAAAAEGGGAPEIGRAHV